MPARVHVASHILTASDTLTYVGMDFVPLLAAETLEVVGTRLAAGDAATVAIRQHDIALSAQEPQDLQNAVAARVVRQVFLGASRDYMVETPDGTILRIVAATETAIPKGTEVWLYLPPERCRALSR